ncbi:MAG TPA: hypothetical protein VK625_04175 [Flavitalea sp.]|nr:hypothetical protein [Flavitalea sp.]
MTFRYFIVLLIASSFGWVSCSETSTQDKGRGLMTDLEQTDSVEVIYFRAPDSVRYFTYLALTDKKFIGSLIKNLQQDTVSEISCLKEGKIYLFKKGEIFNTVFFGYVDKDCSFLRFIKNGRLYCYDLRPSFKQVLITNKYLAREAKAGTVEKE